MPIPSDPSKRVQRVPLSLFKQHVEDWKECTGCFLHKTRQRVVFARGKVPCDVLFIGEAPGHSEDSIGLPMIGPAGKVMDDIIKRSIIAPQVRWCITNMICCIPIGDEGNKTEQPDFESVIACQPRLIEFVKICNPSLIVCVGDFSYKRLLSRYYDGKFHRDIPMIKIAHPAAIIRVPDAHRALAVQRAVVEVRNSIDDMLEQKEMNALQSLPDRNLPQNKKVDRSPTTIKDMHEPYESDAFNNDEYYPLFPEDEIPF